MTYTVQNARLNGTVHAIPSKSHIHRLLIASALYGSETEIRLGDTETPGSVDIDATAACLTALGAEIRKEQNRFYVKPITKSPRAASLPCRESGSTLRFLLPVVCALGCGAEFYPEGRLPDRPLSPLREELIRHGCKISEKGHVPLSVSGALSGGCYEIAGNISSQYITGLLLALPLLPAQSEIRIVGKLESRPYVDLTLDVLSAFDLDILIKDENTILINSSGKDRVPSREPRVFYAEGDWSNAAFWLAAGALAPSGSAIQVSGLSLHSRQGDKAIVTLLEKFGSQLEIMQTGNGLCDISVSSSALNAIEIDAADIPDLVPILALTAAAASGRTRIYNAGRLRLKESDRLETVSTVLSGLGAKIRVTEDGLLIEGNPGCSLRGGTVDSYNDHRIAMTAAIAGTISQESVTITNAEAVNKSYPHFWNDFEKLNGV